jgi:hypothetical protein
MARASAFAWAAPPSRATLGDGVRQGRWFALIAVGFAVGLLLRVPQFGSPIGVDSSVFAIVADRWLGGEAIYTDVWDHKPPGIYFVYAPLVAAADATGTALTAWVRATDAAICAVLAALVAGRLRPPMARWSLAAAIVIVAAHRRITEEGGLSEPWALTAFAAALAATSRGRWRTAGVAAGLAPVFSAWAVLMVPGLAWAVFRARPRARHLAEGATLALIAAAVPFAALFATGTRPADAWDALVTYNLLHGAEPEAGRSFGTAVERTWSVVAATGLWLVAAVLFLDPRPALDALRGRFLAPLVSVAVLFLLAALAGGHSYRHYYVLLAVPALAWAGYALERRPRALLAAIAPLLGLFLVLDATRDPLASERVLRDPDAIEAALRAAPDGPLYWWGAHFAPALDAGRTPGYRYFYALPLLFYDGRLERLESLADEFERRPPAVIVDQFCRAATATFPCLADAGSARIARLLEGYGPTPVGSVIIYTRR